MDCHGDEGKFDSLCAIYESVNVGQTIIFVNKRNAAFQLQRRMEEEKHKVGLVVGGVWFMLVDIGCCRWQS